MIKNTSNIEKCQPVSLYHDQFALDNPIWIPTRFTLYSAVFEISDEEMQTFGHLFGVAIVLVFSKTVCWEDLGSNFSWLKLRFCKKASNFSRNHHLKFIPCSASQIYIGDFANICSLLRIYELYHLKFAPNLLERYRNYFLVYHETFVVVLLRKKERAVENQPISSD